MSLWLKGECCLEAGLGKIVNLPIEQEVSNEAEPEIRVCVGEPTRSNLELMRMNEDEFEVYLDAFGTILADMFPWSTIKLYNRLPGDADVIVTHGSYEDHLERVEIVSLVRSVRKGLVGCQA